MKKKMINNGEFHFILLEIGGNWNNVFHMYTGLLKGYSVYFLPIMMSQIEKSETDIFC